MTHKKLESLSEDIYVPLQVGRAGKESFGYLGDDTGDNISSKNSGYCELTGMYWLWKNMRCDIIGICHYRRFFWKDGRLLEKDDIERTLQKYAAIIPNTSCVRESSVYGQYAKKHMAKDLDICRDVIAQMCPEYLPAFDFSMKTILVSIGNMWITRKDLYDRYCEWLFGILFEAEKRIDTTGYDVYQKRVMGFLSERLFRVWLLMQPEHFTEESIRMIETADIQNIRKREQVIAQYMKMKLMPVIQMHKAQRQVETLAPSHACSDGFDGKMPVWVCWWQGYGGMPDIVRCCVESIRRNLPKQAAFRLVTLDNCMEYVTFSETVIQKFNEGKITYARLSDLLGAELLYRYGGMWIDAAYYVTKPIPLEMIGANLFTLRAPAMVQAGNGLAKGRWGTGLWCAGKHHKLFQFVMESFWYYCETNEEFPDYVCMDNVATIAVEEFAEIRTEMEEIGCSDDDLPELARYMNTPYTEEKMRHAREKSRFCQVDWKKEYRKETLAGVETVYGHLVREKNP